MLPKYRRVWTEKGSPLLLHSVALRAGQTAAEISDITAVGCNEVDGVYEVQAGDLEDRADEAAHGQLRHSLWTGDLGLALYLWNCLQAEADFPTLDSFF